MIYFLFSILYTSLVLLVVYFNKKIKLQDLRIVHLIKEKHDYTTKTLKLVKETEAKLIEFNKAYQEYSEKLNIIDKTYKKYRVEWNSNTKTIKDLLSSFETKHDAVETKFKDKEQELKETFESFKKMYEEMHFYLASSTRKLESRPEEIRRELLKSIENKQKQLDFTIKKLNNFQNSVEKETNFLFRRISKLEDTTLRKDNSDFRY